jgi:Alpha/beta hydrolase domain
MACLGVACVIGPPGAAVGGTVGGTVGDTAAPAPLPSVEGPVAVTADSYPFNAVRHNRTPLRIGSVGYVEEEYLIGGSANVYDWPADGSLTTLAAGPYKTRILIRRPARPWKSSGRVVIEMLNPTSLHDLDIIWAATQRQIIRDGDVWVGVTVKPSSIASLQTFDSARYSSLSMANPVPPRCTTTTWSGATPTTENGLVWDMVSQIGALVRSGSSQNPLARFGVRSVYLTGFSQTAGYATTYVNAIAPNVTRADGGPIFDGYLIAAGANFPVPINQCAPRPTPGDARWVVDPPGQAPVISVQTLSDFYALNGFYSRRPDSTGPDGNYRLYEVSGSAHVWAEQVAYAPGGDELVKAGFPASWWDPYCAQDVSDFPLHYALDAALVNLYRWAEEGTPAPTAERIQVSNPTSPTATVLTDQYGNSRGGVRSPYVDVPVATYYGTTPGTGTCTVLWGHKQPLADYILRGLYPTRRDYVTKVKASVATLVAQSWITPEDGKRIIADAASGPR